MKIAWKGGLWVVVPLLLLAFLWFVPQLQGQYFSQGVPAKELPALVNEYRRTWGQILGGAVLLAGLYFTWGTLQVNREGQITERFTRAIDQLGKVEDGQKLFEIRIGGIYALERIATESPKDYWPIMEVLTAYVRQNAPLPPEASQERTEDVTDARRAKEGSRGKSETTGPSAPDPDIQAIMTILRRRSRSYGKGEPEVLHLNETNLSGARLYGANLYGANLEGADLSGALSAKTNLSRAWLPKANLSGARLSEADLSEARLSEARLSGAELSGADLSGATLFGANLSGARLYKANLSEAVLSGVIVESGAVVAGANLSGADLSGANLYKANLSGFVGANLSEANLSEANLSEANLSGAQHLTQEQLEKAEGDKNTKLPSDLKPPAHWGVQTDEQSGEG